jgi:uncharacterized protein
MQKPPVRTITLGLEESHPLKSSRITSAAQTLEGLRQRFYEAGYEVQTVRISTRPLFDDLADWSAASLIKYVQELQHMLDEAGVSYCSLGPAQAARPDFPLEYIDLLPDLLVGRGSLHLTAQLASSADGVREEAALPIARAILRLAHQTPDGSGNFNFAMLACVEAGTPFFPSAYHAGSTSISLGLQGAGIISSVAQLWQETGLPGAPSLLWITQTVKAALEAQARPPVEIAQAYVKEHLLRFGGIDLSPAPMGTESIARSLAALGRGSLGDPGAIALTAALTGALKTTDLPTCGYCGLMLPVLEDELLGKYWAEGRITTHELLLYSTVCGTGLDTVPLAGDTSDTAIAQLLLDVATLAWRLHKPLSARLFPVPGKQAGEYTTFTSPYLTNTRLR